MATTKIKRALAIKTRSKLLAGVACLVGVLGLYWVLAQTGALTILQQPEQMRAWFEELGVIGPFAVIAAMTLAIVISPLPSAPIALAAGALFGHTWGTMYVIVGAESGALLAFAIARVLGQDMVDSWFRARPTLHAFKSQNTLTVAVFTARLLPFLSFDVISYAAGLSPLRTWRFALATLIGIAPASFALAHFGGELGSGDMSRAVTTVLALGGLTFASIATGWWWRRRATMGSGE